MTPATHDPITLSSGATHRAARPGSAPRLSRPALLLALVSCCAASTAWAGFEASLRAQRDWLSVADPTGAENEFLIEEEGGGLSLGLGYSFGPSFAALLRIGAASHTTNYSEDAVYGTVMFEGQWRPLPQASLQPYLLIGLGGAAVEVQGDVLETSISGGAASLGAGLLLPLTDHFRIESELRIDRINWDRVRVTARLPNGSDVGVEAPVDDSGGTAKIAIGIGWGF